MLIIIIVKTTKAVKDLEAVSALLPSLIDAQAARTAAFQEQMDALKKAGLIYANPHLRQGKYFYLVYPVKNGGVRKREYVGIDPDKIAQAKASIERAKRYEALAAESRALDHQLTDAGQALQRLATTLGRLR